ncbi:MAG TPA: hypothetical protein VG014_12910 [Acidimicrobiales bacterium]|nr:hypothetical protein [Acidimicrobiales bacterium]
MFVSSADPSVGTALTREKSKESLAILAERTRPTSSSQTRLLPVAAPLDGLFPDRSLRRGSTIVVTGGGAVGGGVTLALALVARASQAGSWCAAVGIPGMGAVAARDLGIDLVRFALVPRPGPAWAEATAAMIDGADLVVLRPPFPPRPAMARRLIARAKERRAILIVLPGRAGWPECPDLRLTIDAIHWDGIGTGEGYLRRRRMTVTATGRRSATRPVVQQLWLPSPTGSIESLEASAPAGG